MIDYYIHFPPTPLKTNFIKPPTMSKKNNKRQRGYGLALGSGRVQVRSGYQKVRLGFGYHLFEYIWVAKSPPPPPWVWGFRVPITIPNAALGVKASINANHALKNADRNYVQVYTLSQAVKYDIQFHFAPYHSNQNSFGKSINTTRYTDTSPSPTN